MLMTVEQAKLFCKKKNIKHLDIRSSTCVRMMFKLNSKLYRMALDDIECTEQGLLRASVIVSDLKNLAKYNHEQFLKQLDNYHFIRGEQLEAKFFNHYIDAFLNAKRITLAPCTIKNYENKRLCFLNRLN